MDLLDRDACYRAIRTRDPRFDGPAGVTSAGIYRRPVFAARTPEPGTCRFFASDAGAAREARHG